MDCFFAFADDGSKIIKKDFLFRTLPMKKVGKEAEPIAKQPRRRCPKGLTNQEKDTLAFVKHKRQTHKHTSKHF